MPVSALTIAASAMDAFGIGVAVTADNVANVGTNEFDPSRVTYEERPDMGGVAVQEIRETDVRGSFVPTFEPLPGPDGTMVQAAGYVEGSGTDLAVEMVHLIQYENAYAANAAVIRTEDEMVGSFLDEVV